MKDTSWFSCWKSFRVCLNRSLCVGWSGTRNVEAFLSLFSRIICQKEVLLPLLNHCFFWISLKLLSTMLNSGDMSVKNCGRLRGFLWTDTLKNIRRSVNNLLFNKTTSEAAWSLVTLVKRPLCRYAYTAAESLHASKFIRKNGH